MLKSRILIRTLLLAASAGALAATVPAVAQSAAKTLFEIPSQPLSRSLRAVAAGAGVEIIFASDAVDGFRASELKGQFGADEAVAQLIAGTGLVAERKGTLILVRGRGEETVAGQAGADIVVTGTHIRGSEPVSPVIADSRAEIEQRGLSDLGAYIRSVPQNYAGGQNPGVISSLQDGSENINSSSAMNLRGLGADATLTLLNGHRLPYDSVVQGVDISAIPLGAIERVEIVADGSSALYGSDAVGGVANVLLRRDYQGVLASARFGAATDGGTVQQQYSAVSGSKWSDGGFMIAGDFNKTTDITAGQRALTGKMDKSTTLYPSIRQMSAVAAGHQRLGDGIAFEFDAQLSKRKSASVLAFLATGDFRMNGNAANRKVTSWSVAPKVRIDLARDWQLSVRGTHGNSDSDILNITNLRGTENSRNQVSYENRLDAIELDAEGAVFSLPGGDARLAVGGGYRRISLDANIQTTRLGVTRTVVDYVADQDILFAYGEASLPIVGPGNARPFLHRLRLTGALRYEDYKRLGGTATPKLGLIFEPVPGFALKGSWGKSFKAPTLAQQNKVPAGDLLPADYFVPEAPGTAPVLLLSGAVPGLEPEKATTWTATVTAEPTVIPGLRIEASYFHTRYKDRVVEPAGGGDQVFGNPAYNELILYDPTGAQVEAAITGLPLGLTNQTGETFDPANVSAIVDNRLQNASSQTLQGIDLLLDYAFDLDSVNSLRLSGAASYLESSQQLSPGQPVIRRAGTIFDPPHWRGRGSISWERGSFRLTAAGTYMGGTTDDRFEPVTRVGSLTSVDMIAQLTTADQNGPFAGIELSLAVLNLLNSKPAIIRTPSAASPPYDATNYPIIGRSVSFTISKAW